MNRSPFVLVLILVIGIVVVAIAFLVVGNNVKTEQDFYNAERTAIEATNNYVSTAIYAVPSSYPTPTLDMTRVPTWTSAAVTRNAMLTQLWIAQTATTQANKPSQTNQP
jgi:hypothetical protein